MSDSSSPLPSPASAHTPLRLRLGLLLLVTLPCLPGLTFLLAGMLLDPRGRSRESSPNGEIRYAEQSARTRSLYLAGGSVLIVGTFGTAAVLWKIARPGPAYEGEPESSVSEEIIK